MAKVAELKANQERKAKARAKYAQYVDSKGEQRGTFQRRAEPSWSIASMQYWYLSATVIP